MVAILIGFLSILLLRAESKNLDKIKIKGKYFVDNNDRSVIFRGR
jgi:hypothetical protein